jgi:hypothetical protein
MPCTKCRSLRVVRKGWKTIPRERKKNEHSSRHAGVPRLGGSRLSRGRDPLVELVHDFHVAPRPSRRGSRCEYTAGATYIPRRNPVQGTREEVVACGCRRRPWWFEQKKRISSARANANRFDWSILKHVTSPMTTTDATNDAELSFSEFWILASTSQCDKQGQPCMGRCLFLLVFRFSSSSTLFSSLDQQQTQLNTHHDFPGRAIADQVSPNWIQSRGMYRHACSLRVSVVVPCWVRTSSYSRGAAAAPTESPAGFGRIKETILSERGLDVKRS